ncbi:hypothetical protein ACFL6S_06230 [Candidatus Poribacteria bacterium]
MAIPILEKLGDIDRRIIYLVIALAVIIPFLIPMSLPIYVSPPVQSVYDYIESIPEGGVVLIGFNFTPSTRPELFPMCLAVLRHCYSRKLKVVGMTVKYSGAPIGDEAMQTVAREYGYEELKDYTYLGYKRGVEQVMLGIGEDISDPFPSDYLGRPIEEIPMMEDIKNYDDIDLVMDFGSSDSPESWVAYAGARYHQTIAIGCTGVMASELYPYLEAKQLVGLIVALKGAAEYEKLIEKPGKASLGMKAQSIAHLAIILLVILGNVVYFLSRRKN